MQPLPESEEDRPLKKGEKVAVRISIEDGIACWLYGVMSFDQETYGTKRCHFQITRPPAFAGLDMDVQGFLVQREDD